MPLSAKLRVYGNRALYALVAMMANRESPRFPCAHVDKAKRPRGPYSLCFGDRLNQCARFHDWFALI